MTSTKTGEYKKSEDGKFPPTECHWPLDFLPYSCSLNFSFLIFTRNIIYVYPSFLIFFYLSFNSLIESKRSTKVTAILKVLSGQGTIKVYLEDEGITQLFQRSSLRLSQPYKLYLHPFLPLLLPCPFQMLLHIIRPVTISEGCYGRSTS